MLCITCSAPFVSGHRHAHAGIPPRSFFGKRPTARPAAGPLRSATRRSDMRFGLMAGFADGIIFGNVATGRPGRADNGFILRIDPEWLEPNRSRKGAGFRSATGPWLARRRLALLVLDGDRDSAAGDCPRCGGRRLGKTEVLSARNRTISSDVSTLPRHHFPVMLQGNIFQRSTLSRR